MVWNIFFFPYIGNVIIPIDKLMFFRGVGEKPPTSNKSMDHFDHGFAYPDCAPLHPILVSGSSDGGVADSVLRAFKDGEPESSGAGRAVGSMAA